MKVRVGIITFHASYNFGSALQAYALQTAIERLGHQSKIIDYRSWDFEQYRLFRPEHPRIMYKTMKKLVPYLERKNSFESFWREHFTMTSRRYSFKDEAALNELPSQFDCFVCGSDQIWNLDATRGIVKPFFLSFAGDGRRVAYAPSLAHTSFRPEYFDKEELSRLLAPFYAISVREQETVNLFQPLVNKRIEICADPTLLLDATSYEPLLQGARQKMEEPYLFVYMLRSCPELVESASRVAELLGVKVFYVSEEALDIANSENLFGIGPEEFLWLIKNATGVLTNSFHATLFSVIFHTPFRTFASDLSSSRVRGFLKDLDIDQCLSTKTDIRPLTIVDWSESDKSVIGMRERSWDFLKGALA